MSLVERYPDSLVLQGSIASCYLALGHPEKAISPANKAFKIEPNPTSLKNFCICLFEADEHESLISLLNEYIEQNITESEKGLFLSLLAISYNEIGKESKSREIINSMKADNNLAGEAFGAEATISRKNSHSREEALTIYKAGKEKYAGNMILLTNYATALNPSDKAEAVEVVDCFERLLKLRELSPEEYTSFSRAYRTLSNPDKSLAVIHRAYEHFPENLKILYEFAISLSDSGDEEKAYEILRTYLAKSSADYRQIRNLAVLAFNTGRIDEAISLLQKALGKTTDVRERGEIHCHLFELKRMTGQPQKELLYHIHRFGETVGEDDILEARYLSMIMLGTIGQLEEDDEIREWLGIARERLRIFSERNPQNPFFKAVKIDMTVPEEEKGKEIFATIMAETLPYTLRTDKLRIAVRSGSLPLAFKATYLGGHSIFEYWSESTRSKETEYRLHIWNPNNNLIKEFETAEKAKQICIDISALMTLAGMELLDILQEFELIILARGTKNLIAKEYLNLTLPHELAQRIDEWRLGNKHKIRIRNAGEDTDEDPDVDGNDIYETTAGGLLIRRDISLKETIGAGMGESILIARQMKLPLYSDDCIVRFLGSNEFGCQTFSTISLLDVLVNKGNIKIEGASEILSRLIQKNFVIVPFDFRHLKGALLRFLKSSRGKKPVRDDIMSDDVLGTLLRQFGDSSLNYSALVGIAVDWWISMLTDDEIPKELLVECMEPVSYALSMHSIGGIIQGIAKEEQEMRLAGIWFRFLSRIIDEEDNALSVGWSAIKTVGERIYGTDPEKFIKLIYERIPKMFIKVLENQPQFTQVQKIEVILKFTQYLPQSDKDLIESYIRKARPNFMI
jgi:tetratricopeptide (TPR) repeat protein